ncbi:hypothetical protein [Prosthecobacter sp.]
MTDKEIIDIQLEQIFGTKFPQKIQRFVDQELNEGHWLKGYDLAVSQTVIDGDSARRLLEIILFQRSDLRIDQSELHRVVESVLPQSMGANVTWIVDVSGDFALSDSLRVARFNRATMIWCSPRISFDEVVFDELKDGKLKGRAWLGSNEPLDAPFVLDFDSGALLKGPIVEP